jgi:hypothetical protein
LHCNNLKVFCSAVSDILNYKHAITREYPDTAPRFDPSVPSELGVFNDIHQVEKLPAMLPTCRLVFLLIMQSLFMIYSKLVSLLVIINVKTSFMLRQGLSG